MRLNVRDLSADSFSCLLYTAFYINHTKEIKHWEKAAISPDIMQYWTQQFLCQGFLNIPHFLFILLANFLIIISKQFFKEGNFYNCSFPINDKIICSIWLPQLNDNVLLLLDVHIFPIIHLLDKLKENL